MNEAQKAFTYDGLVALMTERGWVERAGKIVHDELELSFESWEVAIMACINVASES